MKTYEKGELAKDVLLCFVSLGAGVGLTFLFLAFPGIGPIFKLFNAKTGQERARVRQSIRCLERRGHVRVRKKDGKEYIEITSFGKREAMHLKLLQRKIQKPSQWDGQWRLVMFDIPENKRRTRDAIRKVLKDLELYQYQKSVFVYPYECKSEIGFVAKYFKVRNKISYVVAQHIEAENLLKKKFKLT